MGVNAEIVLCGEQERKEWSDFVERTPSATVCHHYLWQTVIQSAYGHRPFYLLARYGEQVRGVLPLVLVSSRLFGSSLTSMPFLDYGGVCTDQEAIAAALVNRAQDLMHERTVDCVELRQRVPTGN